MNKTILSTLAALLVVGGIGAGLAWKFGWLPLGVTPVEERSPKDPDAIKNSPYIKVGKNDWPWWRGPNRNNIAEGDVPPTEWSETKNVLWKVKVPGRGHSSPIVVGDDIFLTTADDGEKTMSLLCFSRKDGARKWEKKIHSGGFMHKHEENSHASATPACDGERVFTAFMVQDGIWVSAVDLRGEILWQKKIGDFQSKHGFGSSPVLYKSLVIVPGDNSGGSYLVALDRESGDVEWRKSRHADASFGTPIVGKIADRDQLIVHGLERINSHDPVTGEVLWTCKGPWMTVASTPAFSQTHVFGSGGYPSNGILCVAADGTGNVKDSKLVWNKRKVRFYVPSPLILDDKLYGVTDTGIAVCLNGDNGNEVWSKRLGMTFRASPTAIGGNIFFASKEGKTVVLKAGDKFDSVAVNELDEGCWASPVICGGRLYLRTTGHLYCIGKK